MLNLTEAIAGTVRKSGFNIKQLADKTGFSENYLYRISTPGASGCDLTIPRAGKLMQITRNYSILDVQNRQHGFLRVRPPRSRVNHLGQGEILDRLHILHLELVHNLRLFFPKPTEKNRDAATQSLYELACFVEGLRKRVNSDWRQLELDLGA